ncbi:MAG TPA: YdjY domain-containing protein [Tepidisphaeraceae bacterium]|nr:YdjY domain-containing protein [Tepidisphaeraceae bacterium]
MYRHTLLFALIVSSLMPPSLSLAAGKIGKLPHVEFDVANKTVRVECEALNLKVPLEFFCCVTGSNEHESVLRTPAKPSDIQIALLAIGLKPGKPISFSEAANKWIPPQGPPLHISVEYVKDGKTISYPGYRWMRDMKTRKEPKAFTWVYTGSRVMPDGKFAADVTGYVVSIVNFDLTLVDVPELASSANETLEWECNSDLMPKTGTKVWMIIEPAGKDAKAKQPANKAGAAPKAQSPQSSTGQGASRQVASASAPSPGLASASSANDATAPASGDHLSDVHIDTQKVNALEQYWQQKVGPHEAALREAAQAHYKVMRDLRKEQQRLIDEADRIQRAIDKLEKEYQDMTTPRPEAGGGEDGGK